MYTLYDIIENAYLIFGKIDSVSVLLWNSMIGEYKKIGTFKESIKLYCHMHLTCMPPSMSIFMFVLTACT
jgi:hypothetical protein